MMLPLKQWEIELYLQIITSKQVICEHIYAFIVKLTLFIYHIR